jgi:hypothetical protein
MVVITIHPDHAGDVIMPIYSQSIKRAKEQNLRNNLDTMNDADLPVHSRQAKIP